MRYVGAVLLAVCVCVFMPSHVASETPEDVRLVKALRTPERAPVATLATLTGLQPASPTECVAAETRSARAWLASRYTDTARWEFSNIYFGGLAYTDYNLLVIDSDMSDTKGNPTCGYALAIVFHEWVHLRTAEYFGSMDKAKTTLGCGNAMPEFANTCRNIELIADCGGMWLSEMAGVKEHHPYIDKYGCSKEHMQLAQQIIKGS